jgi:hypothetical protein
MQQDHSTRRLRRARATAKAVRIDMRPMVRLVLSVSMLAAVLFAFNTLG